jgi:hypothetical protein
LTDAELPFYVKGSGKGTHVGRYLKSRACCSHFCQEELAFVREHPHQVLWGRKIPEQNLNSSLLS